MVSHIASHRQTDRQTDRQTEWINMSETPCVTLSNTKESERSIRCLFETIYDAIFIFGSFQNAEKERDGINLRKSRFVVSGIAEGF